MLSRVFRFLFVLTLFETDSGVGLGATSSLRMYSFLSSDLLATHNDLGLGATSSLRMYIFLSTDLLATDTMI